MVHSHPKVKGPSPAVSPPRGIHKEKWEKPHIKKLPGSFSWRKSGLLFPISNQGECSCCYAFSCCEAIAVLFILQKLSRRGRLNASTITAEHLEVIHRECELSKQEIVDHSHLLSETRYLDPHTGCVLSTNNSVFEYATNYGISSEERYPYVGRKCKYDNSSPPVPSENWPKMFIEGYHPSITNLEAIKRKITRQPLVGAVSIYDSFKKFKGKGIYVPHRGESSEALHSILIVGYGKRSGEDYFIIKNSWGEIWGDEGYAKIPCHAVEYISCPRLKCPSIQRVEMPNPIPMEE